MARVDVLMPQMGESIAEGTVSKWLKKLGDPVKRDEPLFEISTDKVDAEIPSPTAGVLAEIRVQEGQTVPVQTLVAVIETDKSATVQPAAAAAPSAAAPPPKPAAAPGPPPPAPPASPALDRPRPPRSGRAGMGPRPPTSACVAAPRPSSARSRRSTRSTSRRFRAPASPAG